MTQSRWIALIVGEVLALCCCIGLFGFVVLGSTSPSISTPTRIAQATATVPRTATLLPTSTAERTSTPVVPRGATNTTPPRTTPGTQTPTRAITGAPGGYTIIIPTPTAPKIVYPVDFNSAFMVSTYAVTGKTKEELSRSLEASSQSDPHESGGGRFYARTDWLLSAHWLPRPTSSGCELEKGDVNITITMTLPVLATSFGVQADALNRWKTFIQNTQEHESGHVKLAEQGARDYQRDLGNIAPASNCDIMQTRLRDLFDKSFAAIDKANVNYDAQTQHGFTQGAVFP